MITKLIKESKIVEHVQDHTRLILKIHKINKKKLNLGI